MTTPHDGPLQRRDFKHLQDAYLVTRVMSPFPLRVIRGAALLVTACIVLFAAFFFQAVPEWMNGSGRFLLPAAHLMRCAGDTLLLGSVMWGLSAWEFCPRRWFMAAIATTAVYHVLAAAGYLTVFTPVLYTVTEYAYLASKLILLLLSVSILITFTGKVQVPFLLLALSVAASLGTRYLNVPLLPFILYAASHVLAIAYVFSLLSLLSRDKRQVSTLGIVV